MIAPVVPRRVEPGPLLALAALVAGILAGQHAAPASAVPLLIVGAACLAMSLTATGWRRLALGVVACSLLGSAVMQRSLDGMAHSSLIGARDAGEFVVVRGTVAADPDGMRFRTDVVVRVSAFAVERNRRPAIPVHRLVVVRASGREAGTLRLLTMGDHVSLSGRLEPLVGFDTRLQWRHVTARLVDVRLEALHPATSPLLRVANSLRDATLRGSAGLGSTDRALFAGFLLGDTRDIPDPIVSAYRNAGLSHLLAVSGANVAFVLALVGPLLRRCTLAPRLAVGIGVIVVFAAATRFEPSVLRASVMAAIAMAATFFGRPVSPVRVLAYAVIVLLLVDPFLLHSVGFALSVGASAGIALWSAPIATRLPGPRVVRDMLGVTIAAQLGVAPVLLPVFGALPAITPIANLLAVPVAEPLTVYGFATSLLLSLAAPLRPLASVLHAPSAAMLHWVTLVARTCSRVPLVIHPRGAVGLVAVTCLAAAVWKAGATLKPDARAPVSDAAPR
ncbi:MAG: ComEC/Rec2-related protein [Actinomycetia bacterium]|nr:ComEC/Rec2-related protein [Actinomycetes bacterium]